MKKYFALILVLFFLPQANAQEENNEFKTLFGDRHISHGGYGAIGVNYSQIDGMDAIVIRPRCLGHWA